MKKPLILFVVLFFLFFGGGCGVTALLYNSEYGNHSYAEEVSTFLITQDGEQLIVVGKEHHYIFAANDTLKFTTQWPEKKHIKASFSSFRVKSNQSLSGNYSLFIDDKDKFSSETKMLLMSKGFAQYSSNKRLGYQGKLEGVRYLANKLEIPTAMKLNKKYTITIIEERDKHSAAEVFTKIVLTPITVATDGAILLGNIPLLVIAFILFPLF